MSLIWIACVAVAAGAQPIPMLIKESPMEQRLRTEIRRVIHQAVEKKEIPGAVALVNWKGKNIFCESFGHACLAPEQVVMRPDHIFDLASLTKVVATTTAILILRDQGKLSLDDPASKHLPELNTPDKRDITIRQLLTHTSGLPGYRAYHTEIQGREAYLQSIASEKLESVPGTERKYSDLGFILLGLLIERVSGRTLAEYTRREIFIPLCMFNTTYNPDAKPRRPLDVFAVTEFCPWRKKLLVGEVHDENAYAIGGDAGHAGLFSTADDLSKFGEMLLGGGKFSGRRILSEESVSLLNQPQIPEIDPLQGLGWRIRPPEESRLGFLASPRSFGHTGFTGTTLWIDPDNQVVAVLLTNAIHPDRKNAHTANVRLGFHRAIVETLKEDAAPKVKTGLDVLEAEGFKRLYGQRVGVVTNHSAVNARGEHLLDLLAKHPEIRVAALFGPEHGIRGEEAAGDKVDDARQEAVPIYSLYGKRHKPTEEMGKAFDVMLYDIQDVGARFYTYIWTLYYVEQFCAETGKKLIVLDRPNPIGGQRIEGPVLDEAFASFVGLKPIPIRHGLTVGELAILFNRQGWLGEGLHADLEVVAMEGWKRDMWFDETGLPWISPSPNILSLDTATVYPGICLLEGTHWSEGRGTVNPFEKAGGPGVDPYKLAKELNDLNLPGCQFSPIHFTPESIPGMAPQPRYEGESCGGVRIQIEDREAFQPVKTGLAIVMALRKQDPEHAAWRLRGFDRLLGTDAVRKQIESGATLEEITASWEEGLRRFNEMRKEAMLY